MELLTRLDVEDFVVEARASGRTYEDVRDIVKAAGWEDLDEWLPGTWEWAADQEPAPAPNTSGTRGEIPAEVRAMGFCSGVVFLGFWWGLSNKVWWPALLAFSVGALQFVLCLQERLTLCGDLTAAYLGASIYLGTIGHRLAWQHRQFGSLDEFRETMGVWNLCGLALGGPSMVAAILFVIAQFFPHSHGMMGP